MNSQLNPKACQGIIEIFGDRSRFNKVERIVYSHDMGVMPEQIRKLIQCTPDGVVQPTHVDEVVSLVKLAREFNIPIVPRGAGSSGFGGSIPTKGGIVVDFVRMNKIMEINPEKMVCKVEPGVIWSNLEQELGRQGLALRLYPSSAKSSTVGGWAAQGGSGFGSYEYGNFGKNIVSLEVVLPTGELKTFSQDELKYAYSLCGITGMIVSVTVAVRELDEESVMLAAFPTMNGAAEMLKLLKEADIPLWSVTMTTPSYVALKQKALEHYVLPEDQYLITMVYPKPRRSRIELPVKDMVQKAGGKLMKEKLAQEEWDDKFYPMRFKKLGPTLIASEVIVPIEGLAALVKEIENKFKGQFAIEGTMIGHDRIAVLGFMLADERKLGFPLAYASSLDVIDSGEKNGGHVFAIGMYFTDKAKGYYGEKTINDVWDFKKRMDPQGIMNPGKIIPASLDSQSPVKTLGAAMRMANSGKTLIGLAGRLLNKVQGDDFKSPLSEEITDDTFACALCGYCRNVCTVFDAVPWESNSPRGKYYLLNQYIKGNLEMDEEVTKALYPCTTCKKCDAVCQVRAHNAHHWMSLRFVFNEHQMQNTGLAQIRENVLNTGNFWGLPADQRLGWIDVPYQTKGKIAYWSGCWASTIMDNMAQNLTRILNKVGIEFVYFAEKENCCGLYLALGGYKDDFARLVKRNLEMFNEAGIDTMIFSCPGCYATFNENYPQMAQELGLECDIRFKHSSVYLSELIHSGVLKFDTPLNSIITYHDSCHVGRWFGHYDEPREVIKAIPGVELREMEHIKENSLCCGLVSAFDSMQTVQHSGIKRVTEAEDTGADYLVTNCAGCGSQFNATCAAMGTKAKQIDLGELVAKALGLPATDNSQKIGMFMNQAVELLKDSAMVCFDAKKITNKK